MILQDIYNNLNVIIKKEAKGNRLSPDDYNRVLESTNEAFFKRKLDIGLMHTMGGAKDGVLDTRFIENYMTLNAGNSLTSGVLDLADIEATEEDIAAIVSVKGTYSSVLRKIDYVTPTEAEAALQNLLGRRLVSHPLCYRIGNNLYFLPENVTSVDITYVEWPDVPFLDYYIDTNGAVQYFNESGIDSKNITSSTNASPIVITIASHGYLTGDEVLIAGHETNTAANGTWTVTYVNADSFSLDDSTGNGIGGATGTCTKSVSHVWVTDEIDSNGNTKKDTDPDYSSITKELDYEPIYHYEFMIDCLAQYGLSINEPNLISYSEQKKTEINSR